MKRMLQFAVVLVALATIVSASTAVTLWDQSDYDLASPGFFNSVSGAPPMGMTVYTVNDVVVDNAWQVNEITEYFSATDPNWGVGIFQGTLNIIPKTAALPGAGDDPSAGTTIPMTGTVINTPNGDVTVVTAAVNFLLNPGEYWIAITPEASAGFFGPEFQLSSATHMGDDSASYDLYGAPAPMWMNSNPGFDGSILIKGEITVPAASQSWGKVKTLFEK